MTITSHIHYISSPDKLILCQHLHIQQNITEKKKEKTKYHLCILRIVYNGIDILCSLCAMMRMLFFCSLFCISIVFSQSKKYVYLKQKKYYKVCQNILFLFDWKKNTWITFKFIFHLVDIRYTCNKVFLQSSAFYKVPDTINLWKNSSRTTLDSYLRSRIWCLVC